jgi:hypothetical protein
LSPSTHSLTSHSAIDASLPKPRPFRIVQRHHDIFSQYPPEPDLSSLQAAVYREGTLLSLVDGTFDGRLCWSARAQSLAPCAPGLCATASALSRVWVVRCIVHSLCENESYECLLQGSADASPTEPRCRAPLEALMPSLDSLDRHALLLEFGPHARALTTVDEDICSPSILSSRSSPAR